MQVKILSKGNLKNREFRMSTQPELHTERLVLRPFCQSDAADVQRLAGDRAIAATTLSIPHPYENGMVEEWIESLARDYSEGNGVVFAVVQKESGQLIGAVGLVIKQDHQRGELGYWIGKPYWGRGFCAEAARGIVGYGFMDLELNRIQAMHMAHNPVSGRVMEKLGMQQEGHLHQHVKKWGVFEDLVAYGILKTEYQFG
jgi:RimJ/RimL family protein N-acetyltransferase